MANTKGETSLLEPSRVQQMTARRTAEAKATVPHLVLGADVDLTAASTLLTGAVTTQDLLIRAAALALREVPRANGAYRDGRFELYSRVNVAVMVPGDDAPVAVTIFDADTKPADSIAQERAHLAARAASGELTSPEQAGATFTVSALETAGVPRFSAVIHPPQAAILAAGAVEARPVVRDGAVVAAPVLSLTLACDHRLLYPEHAATLLGAVRGRLEAPERLAA